MSGNINFGNSTPPNPVKSISNSDTSVEESVGSSYGEGSPDSALYLSCSEDASPSISFKSGDDDNDGDDDGQEEEKQRLQELSWELDGKLMDALKKGDHCATYLDVVHEKNQAILQNLEESPEELMKEPEILSDYLELLKMEVEMLKEQLKLKELRREAEAALGIMEADEKSPPVEVKLELDTAAPTNKKDILMGSTGKHRYNGWIKLD